MDETAITKTKVEAQVIAYRDSRPDREVTFTADTKEELYLKLYNTNRTLRYCNGEYYKFADAEVRKDYDKWYKSLSEQTRFNMYYGDGIVD